MGTYVSSVGGHDGKVVVVNDLLHVLNTSEVSKHVTNGNNVSILDERVGDTLSTTDQTGTDGLILAIVQCGRGRRGRTFSMKYDTLGKSLISWSSRSVPLVVPPR
jgi:hypothetical protein